MLFVSVTWSARGQPLRDLQTGTPLDPSLRAPAVGTFCPRVPSFLNRAALELPSIHHLEEQRGPDLLEKNSALNFFSVSTNPNLTRLSFPTTA